MGPGWDMGPAVTNIDVEAQIGGPAGRNVVVGGEGGGEAAEDENVVAVADDEYVGVAVKATDEGRMDAEGKEGTHGGVALLGAC